MNVRVSIALATLLMLVHALTYLDAGPVDDDFICYRYARHLVNGNGLVFNPGEMFEGYTTPAWTLLMALLIRLGLDPVTHSHTIGILAAVVTVFAVGKAWCLRYPSAKWAPSAWIVAATPAFAFHANAGLGTTLLAACLAMYWMEWERANARGKAPFWAAAWLAAAIFVRQECVLFLLPFAWQEWRAGRFLTSFSASLCGVGWTVFRLATYERLLPITYGVKKLPVLEDLGFGITYLWDATLLCGFGVFLVLAWVPVRRTAKHRAAPLLGLAAGLTLHTLYVVWVGGDFVPWARFFMPTLPLAVGLTCLALHHWRGPRTLLVPIVMLTLQWPLAIPPENPSADGRIHRLLDNIGAEQHWAKIGVWMHDIAPPGTRVATSPIGVIGWYSELEVIDLLGLTHDGALDVEPNLEGVGMKGHHRAATAYVLERMPEWVMLGNAWNDANGQLAVNPWEAELVLHPTFQSSYRMVRISIPDVEPFGLFVRKDVPAPPRSDETWTER
jgi:arabinofuranosyltransferase